MERLKPLVPTHPSSAKWALKVLFVGDEGAGKTDLMCSISDGVYIDGFRTKLGSSFGTKRFHLDPDRVQLQIWNLTHAERFKELRQKLYRGGAAVIYVFSLSDRSSFDNIPNWVEEVRQVIGNVPAILVGTRRETRKRRKVTKYEAKELAKHLKAPYFEVGMESDPLFEQALQNLVTDILKESLSNM
ncbi:MAG: GTP-binding protein [Candidatus Hodarchaeota archaeon]